MSVTEMLIARNAVRRDQLRERQFKVSPDLRALVLTCADHRVDPAHVLGLDLGEAVVLRNPGGRVTPAFMQNLVVLAVVAAVEGMDPGFELILMQHTDCGITRLDSPDYSAMVASYFGLEDAALPTMHLSDPHKAVRAGLETLRANSLMPSTLIVSGIVYDVATGSVEPVFPAAPLRSD